VTLAERPKFGKGVRLRRESDGTAMLLVPEGALVLNPSATATLELVDGARSLADIVAAIVERFDVEREQARADVCELIDRLAARRLIELTP
jgi:pyrroloquinoline quinone biosynthesis protein D